MDRPPAIATAALRPPPPASGLAVRLAARAGDVAGPTAGLAPGCLQTNLVILPADAAEAFARFCTLNPKPCPVIGVSEPGARDLPVLGRDLDLARDAPRYRVWRDGLPVEDRADVADLWRGDLVAFALGCSFSFENALMREGLVVRHVALSRNVPMFVTNLPCRPAGPFAGPLVVSMRPYPEADVARVAAITGRYPRAHGAPVHVGDPAAIGIRDLSRPDFGDAVPLCGGETPVFWACGVTPQLALGNARLPFAITHAPGHMLVTDLPNEATGVQAGSDPGRTVT
jgi:uncharacterized protein YcsI (UPF0317 family)